MISLIAFLKMNQPSRRDRSKKIIKRRSNCWKAGSTGVVKARYLGTDMRSWYEVFEKPYKNHLIQNQAMEIAVGRTMHHCAILGDFASPDSQIAMETSIIGCRIARILLQCDRPVTGLSSICWTLIDTSAQIVCNCYQSSCLATLKIMLHQTGSPE